VEKSSLSSALTPIYKYVFPFAWLVLFYTFIISPSPGSRAVYSAYSVFVFVLLGAAVVTLAIRLKSVKVDAHLIYIRGFRGECVERLDSIVGVDEQWLIGPGWARIAFKQPTAFGSTIVFVPRGLCIPFLGNSEGVVELRKRISLLQ